MGKGIGLIGNFRGKVGNMVGYNLKDSNNKQTQGVRVYQPVVKNPKSAGQAEQRAKLATINTTYRVLKGVIDRGQESKAYGNKSRLAWLSQALKEFNGGWFEKGAPITWPAIVPITRGTLSRGFAINYIDEAIQVPLSGVTAETQKKVGVWAKAMLAAYPNLQAGDQLTFVHIVKKNNVLFGSVQSFVLDPDSTENLPTDSFYFDADSFNVMATGDGVSIACSAILSREGSNGQHLRSTEGLTYDNRLSPASMTEQAKQAAIKSYMAGGVNSDWPEEQI